MRDVVKKRSKTIAAKDPAEFDKLYNSAFDELAKYDPEVEEYMWGDKRCATFKYTETLKITETQEDDFMQHNVRCTCSDCPFLEVGTDARRKWFPCPYSDMGETRIDASACETFYREAVRLMRKEAGR